ncbi:MAG: hypothetical protein NWE89_06780 [Candidatus Bathyarchaeota archaeon]|nr:hypothetical protein [Candidatus Bathyarchaeota archaeon]
MKQNKTNLLMTILTFTLLTATLSINPVNADTIQDHAICYDYRTDTLTPKGRSNAYLTTSEYAGLWVNISNPSGNMRVIWRTPTDDQYDNNVVNIIELEGKSWGIIFDRIKVEGTSSSSPGNNPGIWKAELWIDGELQVSQDIQIFDYNEIVSDILDIRAEVQEIVDEKDALQEQYQELDNQYNELLSDYEDLETSVSAPGAIEDLQDEYNQLEDDYRDLQLSLETTKMMMYAAVVVAIASVAIAVYFGAIKR